MAVDPNYQPRNFRTVTTPSAGDIIQGTIISTAKIQLADSPDGRRGRIRIVAVFNISTYHMFYFEFEAPNMRAPRRKWTFTNQYHSIYGDGANQAGGGFFTLESYAAYVSRRHQGTRIVIKRYIKSKVLRELIEHVQHPDKAQPRPGDTFFISSRISSGKSLTKFDRAALTAQVKTIFNSQIGEK